MLLQGFRLGMLLQLAVGPMCLLVFNTSSTAGILPGLLVVLSIALVDGIYIALAGFGIAAFLGNGRVRRAIKTFGGLVLIVFGANALAGAFGISLLPSINLFSGASSGGYFMRGFLLTASNPLTVIFWGGVFSSQVAENRIKGIQLAYFGLGCILSTLVFLGLVAILGSFMGEFLPELLVRLLNAAVGLVLIIMGIRLPFGK